MKKRTLAALAATMLFAVTTVDTFVAPHMAHAQASDATASAAATPPPHRKRPARPQTKRYRRRHRPRPKPSTTRTVSAHSGRTVTLLHASC